MTTCLLFPLELTNKFSEMRKSFPSSDDISTKMYNEITNYAEWTNDSEKFFAQITVNFNEGNFCPDDVMQKLNTELFKFIWCVPPSQQRCHRVSVASVCRLCVDGRLLFIGDTRTCVENPIEQIEKRKERVRHFRAWKSRTIEHLVTNRIRPHSVTHFRATKPSTHNDLGSVSSFRLQIKCVCESVRRFVLPHTQ